MFHAATVGGATALSRDDLGRLAAGKTADLVLVDLTVPQMVPERDSPALVHPSCGRPRGARGVDGRQVVADVRVTTLDQADAGRRLAKAQRRMLEMAPQRDYRGRGADRISPLSLPLGD